MGTDISITLHTSSENAPTSYTNLIRHLLANSSSVRFHIFHHNMTKSTEINLQDLYHTLEEKLPSLIFSDDYFRTILNYNTPIDSSICICAYCYGQQLEMGKTVRNNGHISLVISLKELIPREEVENPGHQPKRWPVAALSGHMLNVAEELFLRTCGLLDSEERYIQHGAMYLESGWAPPEECAFLYHRDVQEFARDFMRMYAAYHWGILPPALFDPRIDVWALTSAERQALQVMAPPKDEEPRHLLSWERHYPDEVARQQFVANLYPASAQRLARLPGDRVRDLIHAACQHIPEVRCYDFGARGLVLASSLETSLWRAYTSTVQQSSLWRVYDYIARAA